jgi:single-strand DNA-binding protein
MSINKVILVGNVGKDPEVRYFDNDSAVANFTLATTERGYTTNAGQQIPDRTEWHNIVAWRGLAKLAENYIKKGTQLYIEGKLRTRSWDDKDGNKRYTTEIFADVIQLLGRKSDNSTASNNDNAQMQQPTNPSLGQTPPSSTPMGNDDILGEASEADDLPF